MTGVKAKPDNFNSVNAYVVVPDCKEALAFYAKAFGAEAGMCMDMPDGSTVHAEMTLGDSTIMLSDENPAWGNVSAKSLGGSPVSLMIYVDDADAVFRLAVEAGAEIVYPMEDTFWGDRYGKLTDPFGISWGVATRIKDLSPEEIAKGQAEFMALAAQKK